jgi:hypothetical protein
MFIYVWIIYLFVGNCAETLPGPDVVSLLAHNTAVSKKHISSMSSG